jgi:ABC-2 type transport system permease protein
VRPISSIRLVAAREITERLRSRALRISTAVMALFVVAGGVVPALVRNPPTSTTIGLVGPGAQALTLDLRLVARAEGIDAKVVNVMTAAAARRKVNDGSLDAAGGGPHLATVAVVRSISPRTQALLDGALDEEHQQQVLTQAGVLPATLTMALTPVALKIDASRPVTLRSTVHTTAALLVAMLLYLVLLSYGNALAGVAQEKASRTAEVLLGAIRRHQLLAGKVSGIGLGALGQITIVAIAGLIADAFVHSVEIPSTVWLLLLVSLLWFALGYAFYSFGYAAAGASGGVINFTGRIYANALLQGGGKLTWYAALKLLKYRASSGAYKRRSVEVYAQNNYLGEGNNHA